MKLGVYTFCIALFIYHFDWWVLVKTDEIFSLVGSNYGEYCLTNSSSAMYYISDDGFHEETRLFPASSYFCTFERNERHNSNRCWYDFTGKIGQWEIVNSLNYENYPIFDMRWEDLPVRNLYFKRNQGLSRLYYTEMLNISDDGNFRIIISLRAIEVHLLLCDIIYVQEASCYWFILQGWRGTKTAFRKCKKQIPVDDKSYPRSPCADQIVSVQHPEEYPTYLAMEKWGHVILEKQGRIFFLRNIKDGKTETIFQYTEKDELFDINYMLGHTRNQTAYYKIHMHNYLRTSFASKSQMTGNQRPLIVKDGKVCLSMMITTCKDCWTHVFAYTRYNGNFRSDEISIIDEKQLQPSPELWTEHKIEFTNIDRDIHYLIIGIQTTSNNSDLSSQFWAIDNYRECSKKEYRVSVLKKSLNSCHLISSGRDITWGLINSSTQRDRCSSWKEFGESCIPCDALDGTDYLCQKQRMCELVSGNKRCFCSPGYTGSSCDKACDAGLYGYGCSKQCGNCFRNASCRVENGYCSKCEENFEGPTCIKSKTGLVLKEPPSIIESRPHSCTVQLVNKRYIGDSELNYYLVQYQKSFSTKGHKYIGSDTWKDYSSVRSIDDDVPTVIEGLESSTEYRIRILTANEENKIKTLQNYNVPYALCNTTCDAWNEKDITVTPGSEFVLIKIVLPKDRCEFKSYNWTIKGEDGTDIFSGISTKEFSVAPLAIFKPYKIIFSGPSDIITEFRTTESDPSKVRNIVQGKLSKNMIHLNWKEPIEPNGIIGYYKVEYRKIHGKYCSRDDLDEKKETNISDQFIELTNLEPFSVYLVTIYAGNQNYLSEGVLFEAETSGLDTFTKDEDFTEIELNLIQANQSSATFKLNNFKCRNVQGPLRITYNYNCMDEWCEQSTEKSGEISPLMNEFSISELQAFSNYSCSITFCRRSNCKTVVKKYFATKASYYNIEFVYPKKECSTEYPNNIRQVLVTSKGTNYIYLRWLSPYPPTGTLKNYRINTYCTTCYTEYRNQINFEPQKCAIWPDFSCAKLTRNIFEGFTFYVQIQASNYEIEKYVEVYKSFEVVVKEEASQPPFGLKIQWQTNSKIILLWNHPNETNGNLKRFKIRTKVNDASPNTYEYNLDETKYKMTYRVQLHETIPTSSDIYVEVYAENTYQSSPAMKNFSSFPATPILVDPHISITNYTKSTMTISMNLTLKDDEKKNTYYLFILVTDMSTKTKDENVLKLENILNTTIDQGTHFRMAAEIIKNDLKTTLLTFVLGENDKNNQSAFLNTEIRNIPLLEGQYYNITIFLLSDYKKKYKFVSHSIGHTTLSDPQESTGGNGAYALLLLLLVPLIIGATICWISTRCRKYLKLETVVQRTQEDIPMTTTDSTITKFSKQVKLMDFEEYVKKAIASEELERQFEVFVTEESGPLENNARLMMESANLYTQCVEYDFCRVKLLDFDVEKKDSNYINASYINGHNVAKAYIVTPSPKAENFLNFWKIIWQENVKNVVMISNANVDKTFKEKRYWPNVNEKLNFGGICVESEEATISPDFEQRIFSITRNNVERKLEQIHFPIWPRQGVPLYSQSLIPFVRKISKIRLSSSSPVVVHCSDGVSETGTILLIDINIRTSREKFSVDFFNTLRKLRKQKQNMVSNVSQYKLAHLVVLQIFTGLQTSISCENIDKSVSKIISEEQYKIQMAYLDTIEWQNRAMECKPMYAEILVNYPEKSRIHHIIPGDHGVVTLESYPKNDLSSSYINAVHVDGFQFPEKYIVTQQPMPNTLGDFWRLVAQKNIGTIVSLNHVDIQDQTCCEFLPTPFKRKLQPIPCILVELINMVEMENYDIFCVHVENEDKCINLKVIVFKKWPAKCILPSSCEEFLSFWEEADTTSKGSHHVLVTCYDGATASGVYVALSFIIEKIKAEQECDVCLGVQTVRRNRKQFVTREEQFVFLFVAAARFVNGFNSYANFKK